MGKQSAVFLETEGAAWLRRNLTKLADPANDPVIATMKASGIIPRIILEVGCANGWRLRQFQKTWPCIVAGIDPGVLNVDPLWMDRGTADNLSMHLTGRFDTVVYGFCLYLCDREDLFKIVAEGDRVLKDGGHLIVYDFHADTPFARHYAHYAGVHSYKMDYAKLWLSNPAYSVVRRERHGLDDDKTCVTIMKKNLTAAWPIHD